MAEPTLEELMRRMQERTAARDADRSKYLAAQRDVLRLAVELTQGATRQDRRVLYRVR